MASANSSIINAKKIEKQRINDDWQYLDEKEQSPNPTVDQKFNLSYKSRGVQSTTIKNPKLIETQKVGDTLVSTFNAKVDTKQIINDDFYYQPEIKVKLPKKKISRYTRVRAVSTTLSISSWVGFTYITLQLPFAILSLIGLAAAGSISGGGATSTNSSGFIGWVKSTASSIGNSILDSLGIGHVAYEVFLYTYIIIIALGIITILGAFLQYTLAGLRPLSGTNTNSKISMLLLAILGYTVPILNLFPFIIGWIFTVMKYPK